MSRIEGGKINVGNSFVLDTQSSRLSEAEIMQAKQVAENIIEEAKKKALVVESQASSNAEKIIEEAKIKANSLIDETTESAKQRGYNDGYKEGFEKIIQEMTDTVENLENFAKSTFEMKNRVIKSMHVDIVDMVLALSRNVCHTELTLNPKLLEELTLAAISQLKEKENINIIVNPQMAEKIYGSCESLKEKVKTLETIKIIEDVSVSADGTIVESVGSRVDSRLCAQIDKIAQQLYNDLNSTSEKELVQEFDELQASENGEKIKEDEIEDSGEV